MHSFKSSQDGVTFHYNGDPEGGPLHVTINLSKINTEMTEFGGDKFLSVDLEYNAVRDLVLHHLRNREIARLEKADGDELAAYYTGDWDRYHV